ncbi:NitT/TauT family transport system permease protein [Clostridium cavendishii DSM 21758]|uniref:NitT/TauT family transport system permease protein n=1 Tax=Clostridium cavendishii DSM 21758 TaxID=1121302 RepID=A0A1M6RXV1_9CLOT|nr:ABC transporter permease subunit [Clostridium cavendishii]SHK37271.1 NitT/TauT family transport system permease protein [Clostridium cavendishii DSM 21758]
MKESSWKNKIQVLLSSIILVIVWQIVALKLDNPIYLPTVDSVFKNLNTIIKSGDFFLNVYNSLNRTIISFLLALIIALVLGLVASLNKIIRNMLRPINALATSIPTMVLVVLALIWFNKDKAPLIVGFFIVFPILYDGVLSGILNIDKNIIEMTDVFKVKLRDKLLKVYFPAIKFQILNLLVSTFSLAFKVVIAGEVHGQPQYGIGTVIQYEKMNFNTDAIFAWIIIIAIISFLLQIVQRIISKTMFGWKA